MQKEELLKESAKNIFKGSGIWYSYCFNKENRKEVSLSFLPCHLRDEKWLAQLLQTDKTLKYLSYDEILEFVKSDIFQNMRHEYELKTVTWQIKFMLSGQGGWLVPKKFDDDFFELEPDCDIGFREAVILTLTSIGMNQEVIEEGLELNRDIWLKLFMRRAFHNQNNLPFTFVENMEDCSEEYKKAWLNLREYEYYQRNKAMVDKYGKKSLAMQMSKADAQKLKEFVQTEYQKRQVYLKQVEEGLKTGQYKRIEFKIGDYDLDATDPKFDDECRDEHFDNIPTKPKLLTRIRNVFKKTR